MDMNNVTLENIDSEYFFNFTYQELLNLSLNEFKNFQPNLTNLGK